MKDAVNGRRIAPGLRKNTTSLWTKMEGDEKQKKNGISIKWLKFAQKLIYVVVLFILTLILLVQICNCLVHYGNEPTYVETKVAPQHKALFPAMTICPQNNGYNEAILKVFWLAFLFNICKI